jgi:hypothetical protein
MQEEWFYFQGGHRGGPVSFAQLRQLTESSALQATDLVWKEGATDWMAAGSVEGLFPPAAIPIADFPPVPATAAPQTFPGVPTWEFITEYAMAVRQKFRKEVFPRAKAFWQGLSWQQQVLAAPAAGLLSLAALVLVLLVGVAAFGGKGKPADRPSGGNGNAMAGGGWQVAEQPTGGNGNAMAGGGSGAAQQSSGATSAVERQRPPIDPRFIGKWKYETYVRDTYAGDASINLSTHRTITIYANGQFTDSNAAAFLHGSGSTGVSEGSKQGWVKVQGFYLIFTYDNGDQWKPIYTVFSNGMYLDGYTFERTIVVE